MAARQAWFCPACQRHHAPHVDTCPGQFSALPVLPYQPFVLPTFPYPGTAGDTPMGRWPATTGGSLQVTIDPTVVAMN